MTRCPSGSTCWRLSASSRRWTVGPISRCGCSPAASAAMALPPWLDPLYGADAMRAIDAWAIDERHIASLDLMERAGAGIELTVDRLLPRGPGGVVCGEGNKGGGGH